MGDEAEAVATPLEAANAAAQAATEAFVRGGAPAAEAESAEAEASAESKEAAGNGAEESTETEEERPSLKRAQRLTSGYERIQQKLQRDAEERGRMSTQNEEVSQLRSELDKARQSGEISQKQWNDIQQLVKEGKHNEAAQAFGFGSFQEWAQAFVEGNANKPKSDPEVARLREELEELRKEREAERKEREEQRLREQQEQEYGRLQKWVNDDISKHPVHEVRAVAEVGGDILNDFSAKVISIMEQDPELPADEVYGTILDGYRPLYDGLAKIFSPGSGREAPGGLKTEASGGSKPEANRRGSNAERRPPSSSTIDSEAAAGSRETPRLTTDTMKSWDQDQTRAFINRLGG